MKKLPSNGPLRSLLVIGLLLAFGSLVLAVTWYVVPFVSAYLSPVPASVQEYHWSYVEVPKPVKVAAPLPLAAGTVTDETASTMENPTATPVPSDNGILLPTSTEPPGEMTMEIVDGASAPVHPAGSGVTSYNGSKYILVDISEQHMYVYEGDTLIYSFVASTGLHNATRVGTFAVQSKIPNAYGATWNIWMPNWLGIYWAGSLENGIHALPILSNGATLWEGYLGRPVSYGCVVLGTYESSLLYDWAEIGVPVEIQW